MYSKLPNLIIAFHGCDKSTYDRVMIDEGFLQPSVEPFDWLGNGIYFWENNSVRALEWAKKHRKVKNPAVIGAVIDPLYCLNFSDMSAVPLLKLGFELLQKDHIEANKEMPINKSRDDRDNDLVMRDLDCAVIERMHKHIKDKNMRPFDSVRGVYVEGDPIFEGGRIMDKTHVQICIRNINCIKGYFRPLQELDEPFIV